MFNELDNVALTVNLPDYSLTVGNVGTIVQLYSPDAFEVEFVDETGRTYGLLTLHSNQVLRLRFAPAA